MVFTSFEEEDVYKRQGDWREHQVTEAQVYGRQRRTAEGSEKLYEVTDQLIRENIAKGNIRK